MTVTLEATMRIVLTPLHRQNRYCWCRQHLRWTQRQWQSVMFTDESRFCIELTTAELKCGDVEANVTQIVVTGVFTLGRQECDGVGRYIVALQGTSCGC